MGVDIHTFQGPESISLFLALSPRSALRTGPRRYGSAPNLIRSELQALTPCLIVAFLSIQIHVVNSSESSPVWPVPSPIEVAPRPVWRSLAWANNIGGGVSTPGVFHIYFFSPRFSPVSARPLSNCLPLYFFGSEKKPFLLKDVC